VRRLAELPDIIMLLLILGGVLYPAFVFIGHKYGFGLIPPSLLAPRVGPVATSSLMFGLGLVLAGAKYRVLDPPAAKFFNIAGWFLIALAALLWIRRSKKSNL
jgi:hypothetical protein